MIKVTERIRVKLKGRYWKQEYQIENEESSGRWFAPMKKKRQTCGQTFEKAIALANRVNKWQIKKRREREREKKRRKQESACVIRHDCRNPANERFKLIRSKKKSKRKNNQKIWLGQSGRDSFNWSESGQTGPSRFK